MSARRRCIPFLARAAFVGCASILSVPAEACSQSPNQPSIIEPVFTSPDISVERAEIDLECPSDDAPRPLCTFEARYHVRNVQDHASSSEVLVAGRGYAQEWQVLVDGAPAPITRVEVPEGIFRKDADDDGFGFELKGSARAFDWRLGAGEDRDITVRGVLAIEPYFGIFGPGCEPEPIVMRHAKLGRGDSRRSYGIRLFLAPGVHSNRATITRFRFRHPRAARVDVEYDEPKAPAVALVSRDEGDVRIDEATLSGDASSAVTAHLSFARSTFFNGGPFVGFGWTFAPEGGPRARVGYEVAAPYWLAYSLALESDFSKRLDYVFAVDWLTNNWHSAFGFGVGVPLRVQPTKRLGARAEASWSFDALALRAALDVYPRTSTLSRSTEVTLGPSTVVLKCAFAQVV